MIKVYDTRERKEHYRLEDEMHADPVTCVRWTPDENYIVSAAADSIIKIWDCRKRKCVKSFEHDLIHLHKNTKLCISPNSQYCVVGTKEGHMVYIDLNKAEAKPDAVIRSAHNGPVTAVDWMPMRQE